MKRFFYLVAALYLSISFIGMELNPANWHSVTRAAFVLVVAIAACIYAVNKQRPKARLPKEQRVRRQK